MVIILRIELSEHCLKAIAHHIGLKKPASREVARSLCDALLSADLETIIDDYDRAQEEKHEKDKNEI